MKELINSIEALEQTAFDEPRGVDTVCRSDVIDLINKALEGKVIVPVELIQNIDLMTEAGFSAEDQIDELCLLLSTIKGEGDE